MFNNGNQFNPQYYQQQFDNALNQYKNIYGQANNVQTQGFIGQYINSYDEVERAQVSMNGVPTMFVGNGVFWIKKFVNGQAYINAYKFEPVNNVGEPANKEQNTETELIGLMSSLEKRLIAIEKRLDESEGKKV